MNLSVLVGDGEGSKLMPLIEQDESIFSGQMVILSSVNDKNNGSRGLHFKTYVM